MTIEITINIPQLESLTQAIYALAGANPPQATAALGDLPSTKTSAKPTAEKSAKPEQKAAPVSKPEPEPASSVASEETAAPVAGLISDDELRLATAEKAHLNKEAVRDLVKSYAENLTHIPQEKRAEYLQKLEAIK